MTKPDFEALRAERNKAAEEVIRKIAEEMGWDASALTHNFNSNACYCDCASGGPCEHAWDGEGYEAEDGSYWTATCSRCGMTALSHSLRNAP